MDREKVNEWSLKFREDMAADNVRKQAVPAFMTRAGLSLSAQLATTVLAVYREHRESSREHLHHTSRRACHKPNNKHETK